MDARLTPTVTDIARMLDSIPSCRDDGHPETVHVLRWLIERSPPASALRDRLFARRDDGPRLIELARLIIATETGEPYPEAVYTARWLIERSPVAAELAARLEQMAADAGLDDDEPNWAVRALEVHAELERLLATLDDWQDVVKAIELDFHKDTALELLLNVCRARMARSRSDERTRLDRLRIRLQEGALRGHRLPEPEAQLKKLESSLRSMSDPAAALATVEGLLRHLQAD